MLTIDKGCGLKTVPKSPAVSLGMPTRRFDTVTEDLIRSLPGIRRKENQSQKGELWRGLIVKEILTKEKMPGKAGCSH